MVISELIRSALHIPTCGRKELKQDGEEGKDLNEGQVKASIYQWVLWSWHGPQIC